MNLRQTLGFFPKNYLHILLRRGVKDSARFVADYLQLRETIQERLAATIQAYRIDNPGVAYQKYLDTDYWVCESLHRVYMLGLHTATPKTILDLGSGAGYFAWLCKHYGHQAEALDLPDNELYNQTIKILGITRCVEPIRAYTNLPVQRRHDLITAFMICFNNHKTPQLWRSKEWDYFVTSLLQHNVATGGRIVLSFNSETAEEPVSPELLEFFRTNNAKVSTKGDISGFGVVEVIVDREEWGRE